MKLHLHTRGFIATVLIALGSVAHAQVLMEIPGVPGESQVVGFEGFIDITSAGGTFTESNCGDFHIEKNLDSATPLLIAAAVSGTVHPTIRISHLTPGSATNLEFLAYELQNAVVRSISTTSTPENPRPVEAITVEAQSVTVTYTPLSSSGSSGTPLVEGVLCRKI